MKEKNMKSYLDLIGIFGRQRKKENRMTRICIVLAVFLVTVIFGMADMEVRTQKIQTIREGGGWHAAFGQISQEQMELIAARPETKTAARCRTINGSLDQGVRIQGMEVQILGFDNTFQELFPGFVIEEGNAPENDSEAVAPAAMKEQLGLTLGDTVTVTLPDGTEKAFDICGFTGKSSMLGDQEAVLFVSFGAGQELGRLLQTDQAESLFVSFYPQYRILKTLEDIRGQLGISQDQVATNARLLALTLQSQDPYVLQIYLVAVVLAVLVGLAGIFMISGSLNSSTARRTEFFGMMRCLGATRKQVARFVKREALGWCLWAVPAGILMGCVVIWILCAMLRLVSPGIFDGMPVFGISWIGILCGGAEGFLTVLLAARTPARIASRVSPQAAVSGNAGTIPEAKHAAQTGRGMRVEVALGVHHALGSKKNFLLMVLSFSFSILLFLGFSAAVDFLNFAIVPIQPYAEDVMVAGSDGSCSISRETAEKLAESPGVKRCFGRMIVRGLEVSVDGETVSVDLISYEENQFSWAEEFLEDGTVEAARRGEGLLAAGQAKDLGSRVRIVDASGQQQELPVSGVVTKAPGTEDNTAAFICSEELFTRLTGIEDYAVVDIQLTRRATDADVELLRAIAGGDAAFTDSRQSNRENRGAYYSAAIFMYGFLVVIAMIAVFNIVNSIAMSVSSRTQQYGAMRAVGMSRKQMSRMVAAEAWTYGLGGILAGCAAGIPLNRLAFSFLVTAQWGARWEFPLRELIVIVLVVAASVALSTRGPVRRLGQMSIVKNVNTE